LGGWENEETLRVYLRACGLETARLAEGDGVFSVGWVDGITTDLI